MDVEKLIANALQKEGILTPNVLAYALATAQHEAGMVPKGEIRANPQKQARLAKLQNNYEGGWQFHGRGLIQLTHKSNYAAMDKRLGLGGQLVNNPELANNPDIAARILAAFMKDRGVADYAERGDFIRARGPINGTDKASQIAQTAKGYVAKAKQIIQTPQQVKPEGDMSLNIPQEMASMSVPIGTAKNYSMVKPAMAAEKTFNTTIVPTPPMFSQKPVAQRQPLVSSQTGTTRLINAGETLSSIARQYNTSWQNIAKINPQITNPNRIYTGDAINVPQSRVVSTPAKTSSQQKTSTPAPKKVTTPNAFKSSPMTYKAPTKQVASYNPPKTIPGTSIRLW
jgi:LysM repeat protein